MCVRAARACVRTCVRACVRVRVFAFVRACECARVCVCDPRQWVTGAAIAATALLAVIYLVCVCVCVCARARPRVCMCVCARVADDVRARSRAGRLALRHPKPTLMIEYDTNCEHFYSFTSSVSPTRHSPSEPACGVLRVTETACARAGSKNQLQASDCLS